MSKEPAVTVLLVEDNPGDARLIKEMLSEQGSHPTVLVHVESMLEAEKYLADHRIDTILLDQGLPDAQGLETVRRAHAAAPHVPLVVLTGLDDESLAIQALQEGAQDYLNKDQIDTRGLMRAIRYAAERKRAEHTLRNSEERLRLIAESIDEVFWIVDKGFTTVSYVSPAFERVYGPPKADFYKNPQSLFELVHPADLELVRCHFGCMKSGRDLDREYRIVRPDGSVRWIWSRGFPVLDESGEVSCYVGVARDITQRKEMVLDLQTAKEEAEVANRTKSEFLANMSHEIRTPMNGIIGMTDLMLETELTTEQAEYLHIVKGSADALLTLLNDILDFSKMEAGRLELDYLSFDLRKSLSGTARILAIEAYKKDLEFIFDMHPEVPANVVGDPARLRQIIVNLVGNSIKFTEKGEIQINVQTESQSAELTTLRFSVRDTGIGIRADKHDKIFSAFSQADTTTTRKYGGTGLGLSITNQLVGLMGGKLWVESELGKGATFCFTVQLGTEAAIPPATSLDERQLVGVPILVVDDNATNRRIFEDSVARWKMIPTVVEDATTALQVLQQRQLSNAPIPIILTDAHMPGIDGFGLVERIRRNPLLDNVRIVVLTSGGLRGDAARCQKLGVAAYLSKPFDRLDLREVLLRVLAGDPPSVDPNALVTRHTLQEQRQSLSFLVAEDNSVNQRLIARLLEKRGHRVVFAQNGREALEALARQRFDIVLMDGQMPEMDGFEATKRIRESEKESGTHLPIIALTALSMQGDQERCLACGMDGYVSKPLKSEELFSVIETVAPGLNPKHAE